MNLFDMLFNIFIGNSKDDDIKIKTRKRYKEKKPRKKTNYNSGDIDSVTGYPKRSTQSEKRRKGAEYEKYVADVYRQRGFKVEERGRKLGKKDGGIDLIATKQDLTILIQCKNWKENSSWKIRQKDIKAFRIDIREFLSKNPHYITNKMKGRYVVSGNILHSGAILYIKENNDILDYEVIKMI